MNDTRIERPDELAAFVGFALDVICDNPLVTPDVAMELAWIAGRDWQASQVRGEDARQAAKLAGEAIGLYLECLGYAEGDEDAARAMACAEIEEGHGVDDARIERELAAAAPVAPLPAAELADLPF